MASSNTFLHEWTLKLLKSIQKASSTKHCQPLPTSTHTKFWLCLYCVYMSHHCRRMGRNAPNHLTKKLWINCQIGTDLWLQTPVETQHKATLPITCSHVYQMQTKVHSYVIKAHFYRLQNTFIRIRNMH